MFRDNLSVPSSGVKNKKTLNLKVGPIGCPETWVITQKSTVLSYFAVKA
jgi:hypothetical protein